MKLRFRNAVAALALLSAQASAQEQPLTTKCESAPLMATFVVFSETGRMPPNFVKFIGDTALQEIEPYKAFDNVYYVGICWVSAWLITSPNGHVLIDTLYGPYTSQLLGNIRALGFDPKDIKLVVVTHGHFDHAGGIGQLKSDLAPGTRFAMTKEGWREGKEDSSHPRWPWKMIEPDIVLTDGQTVTGAATSPFRRSRHLVIRWAPPRSHSMHAMAVGPTARSRLAAWGSIAYAGLSK
jgi:metallo-beta-lactamase class B